MKKPIKIDFNNIVHRAIYYELLLDSQADFLNKIKASDEPSSMSIRGLCDSHEIIKLKFDKMIKFNRDFNHCLLSELKINIDMEYTKYDNYGYIDSSSESIMELNNKIRTCDINDLDFLTSCMLKERCLNRISILIQSIKDCMNEMSIIDKLRFYILKEKYLHLKR